MSRLRGGKGQVRTGGVEVLDLAVQVLRESFLLWMAVAPYLLVGMFVAGILHAFLGRDFIVRHLGGGAPASVLKATVFGIPLPICSCGVIPVASSLRREGAGRSAVLSFLVSTPVTGVDSILATYSLMGPLFAVFRPLAAFVSGITIGSLDLLLNSERIPPPPAHRHPPVSTPFKIKEVFRYGFGELPGDIGKWLLIGVLAGGVLTVALPENFLTDYFAQPLLQYAAMLVLAVPLYVCATGSIPIAAALILKGISPGAALVFLIAGPATNTIALSFVFSRLGKKAFCIYLSAIVGVSLLSGILFDWLWGFLGGDVSLVSPPAGGLPHPLLVACAAVLFLLILGGWLGPGRSLDPNEMEHRLRVPGMTCRHCQSALERELNALPGVNRVGVDLDRKLVGVNGAVSRREVEAAIRRAGYAPEPVDPAPEEEAP